MAHHGGDDGFGQDHYAQDSSHGGQYGHDQYGADNYDQHQPEDEQDHGYQGHENGAQEGEDHVATMNRSANAMMDMMFGSIQQSGQFTAKPQHAHSRFAQDPHHHATMKHFHKIICEYSVIRAAFAESRTRTYVHADVCFS
jgi:hypothetical protein